MEKVISRHYPCAKCNRNTPHLFHKQYNKDNDKLVVVRMSCKIHHADTLCEERVLTMSTWKRILFNEFK